MNIFILDENPITAARYHCDKHVVKMVLETAQMLSTYCHIKGHQVEGMYKRTHENHPCVKWLLESPANVDWLVDLGVGLRQEYFIRYGRIHKSSKLISNIGYLTWEGAHWQNHTPFTIAAPTEIKMYAQEHGAVQAYRVYIAAAKRAFAKWKDEDPPYWWGDACAIADDKFPGMLNDKNDGVK